LILSTELGTSEFNFLATYWQLTEDILSYQSPIIISAQPAPLDAEVKAQPDSLAILDTLCAGKIEIRIGVRSRKGASFIQISTPLLGDITGAEEGVKGQAAA
jgi:hypothetical protein